MPHYKISDSAKEEVSRHSPEARRAFVKAFDLAYKQYGHDENKAFAVAHEAAKRTDEKRARRKPR